MLRLPVLISFLVCLQLFAHAQTDSKAQKILKEVSAKYKSYKSLQASFRLEVNDQKAKKKETQNGSVTLQGGSFNLVLGDQTVMSDGKTNWTYLKESNEVQISEAKVSSDAITPANVFTLYEKGFRSKFTGEKKLNGHDAQLIELVPDDNKKNYFKIILTINKPGKYVEEARVYDKSGVIYNYSIVKFTPDAKVTADLFQFNKSKFPGVEVIDLR